MAYLEQKTALMFRIAFLLFSSFLLLSCDVNYGEVEQLPYYNEPDFSPLFVENDNSITHLISDFSFYNQDSILISQSAIEGKIHVASFVFTSCGSICPTMTKHMKIVSDNFRDDDNLVFLSYSVTPWIDTPSVLKAYKNDNEINNSNWHFLTGEKGKIYELARQSYFAEEDIGFSKDSTEFLHTEHFILVDKTKRIRGIYNGTLSFEMEQLIEDINTLKGKE